MSAADLREEEALGWARRIADPEFTEWDAHVAWLERDPANPEAFDRALLLIEDATQGLAPALAQEFGAPAAAVNDNRARSRHGGTGLLAGAAALAASVAALVVVHPFGHHRSTGYAVTTAPGEIRALALADGSRVVLNGASRVELDHADPRLVRLDRGEAFFAVRHDARRPFAVTAGTATFQDVGTAFDVRQLPQATEIAVSEGAVLFDPAHAAVRLDSGQSMTIAQGTATVRQIDPAAAGSWRTGRLIYRDAPLAVIAGDIQRATGVPVRIDESLADRHFSGVIILDGNRRRMFERIGAVMGVVVRQDGRGWLMKRPIG